MNSQREWFETNYYESLGVSERATAKEIQKAYRKLARNLHPDKNPGDTKTEERFKEVSAAYDVLGDENKRKQYDEVRAMGPIGRMGGRSRGFTFNVGGIGDDLFGTMFGGGGHAGGSGVGPRRGSDTRAKLTIDFVAAVTGIETSLFLTVEEQCSTCSGSGARPGTSPQRCAKCGGRGVVDDDHGLFAMSKPCPVCQGHGVRIEFPCGTCSATGVENRPREVKTRIPAGVKDGQTIKLKGRGGPNRHGGPNGDLLIELNVVPHELFGRIGDDLTVSIPITFALAALGGEIDVPTIDDRIVTMRIQAGTQSGSRHRVKGHGIHRTSESGEISGDLIVTVNVIVPTKLSATQRAAIEAFDEASTLTSEVAS